MKPWDLRALVWNREWRSSTELLVMLQLAEHADEAHSSYPAQASLAAFARSSVRTVKRVLGDLEERGLLSRTKRWKDGRRTSNRYWLDVDAIIALPTVVDPQGDRLSPSQGANDVKPRGQNGDARGHGHSQNGQEPSVEHLKAEPTTSSVASDSDAARLAHLLADLIEANGSKRPDVTPTWVTDLDRLMRLDGKTPEQVERAIRWCQADDFWRGNILSARKLRAKYDQLRLAAMRTNGNGHRPTKAERNRSVITDTLDKIEGLAHEPSTGRDDAATDAIDVASARTR